MHRDLKAENVLIDNEGRVKLADLGVAQVNRLLDDKEVKVVQLNLQDERFRAPEKLDQWLERSTNEIPADRLLTIHKLSGIISSAQTGGITTE